MNRAGLGVACSADWTEPCGGASTPVAKMRAAKPAESRMTGHVTATGTEVMREGMFRAELSGNIRVYPYHFVTGAREHRNDTVGH